VEVAKSEAQSQEKMKVFEKTFAIEGLEEIVKAITSKLKSKVSFKTVYSINLSF
jgi:hypothetical protein